MSDKENKLTQELDAAEAAETAGKVPAKVVSDYDKEVMYKAFKRGISLTDIAEEFGVSYRSLTRYKSLGNWDERKMKELAIVDAAPIAIAEEAYTKLLKSCWKLADIVERQLVFDESAEGDAGARVNLKMITDCIDKLTRLHLFAQAGGVNQVHVKSETHKIDYAEMAKIYMKAKKEGVDYDAKAHLQDVIDTTYTKKDKK